MALESSAKLYLHVCLLSSFPIPHFPCFFIFISSVLLPQQIDRKSCAIFSYSCLVDTGSLAVWQYVQLEMTWVERFSSVLKPRKFVRVFLMLNHEKVTDCYLIQDSSDKPKEKKLKNLCCSYCKYFNLFMTHLHLHLLLKRLFRRIAL